MCQWQITLRRAHYSLAKRAQMLCSNLLPDLTTVYFPAFLSQHPSPYQPVHLFHYLSSCLMGPLLWRFSSRVVSSPQQIHVLVALALWHARPRKRFCPSTPILWAPPQAPRLTVPCGNESLPASYGSTSCAIIGDCLQAVLPSFCLTCCTHSRAQSCVWQQLYVAGMVGTMQRRKAQYFPSQ